MGKGLRERVTKAKGQDSDRNTAADIAEAAEVGDDDDDDGKSEDGESVHEDQDGEGGGGQRTQLQKRRQTRSFLLYNRSSEEGRVRHYPYSHV